LVSKELIDTADGYSAGESEVVVGEALKGRRDDVVLATKFSRAMGEDPNRQGTSRRWITRAVEDSLRRLQTDYIDVYQIHRLDPDTRQSPAPCSGPALPSSSTTCSLGIDVVLSDDILDRIDEIVPPRHRGRRARRAGLRAAGDARRGAAPAADQSTLRSLRGPARELFPPPRSTTQTASASSKARV